MTNQEVIDKLQELENWGDKEIAHLEADRILLAFLRANGFADVAEARESLEEYYGGFWYA